MPSLRAETNSSLPAKTPGAFWVAICASACVATAAMGASPSGIIYQPHPDSPIGHRNPKGPPELAQFDFVIGDWDIDVTWFPPKGEPVTKKARWHNSWIVDGTVVMQEWRGPFSTGAELRAWDKDKSLWVSQNIYTGTGWSSTQAQFADGKMVVSSAGAADAGGPFISRETYYDIAPNSFKLKSEKSYDAGKTWVRGGFELSATRIQK